ncbi:glutamate racemase [Lichenicoccus sp.]|uniref:glutamate racemase n=1 Tax=Lichenicoccus sp. TaxID=2781899 RepID=UPI003D11F474
MAHILAFDSGIGGYGIVAALRRRLPAARVTMLADNACYPYGALDDTALILRLEEVIGGAITQLRPDLVVIACNTASTVALASLRQHFALPFVGCVPPIKWAATLSRSRTIGLLATKATVRRRYLQDLAQRFAPDCRLIAHGAGSLADLAETAFRGWPVDPDTIRVELDALFGQDGGALIDTVCIGCTHYSFLLDALRAACSDRIAWLDPAEAVARRTETVLATLSAEGGAQGGGDALFTAPPSAPDLLRQGLARFGYGDFSLFAV